MRNKIMKITVIVLGMLIALSLTALFVTCGVTARIDSVPFIDVYKDHITYVSILSIALCIYFAILFYWLSSYRSERVIHSNSSIVYKALVDSYDEVSVIDPVTTRITNVRCFKGYQNVYDSVAKGYIYEERRQSFIERYVVDEDKEHFEKMTNLSYVMSELQYKNTFRLNYTVKINGRVLSYSTRFTKEIIDGKESIIMAVRNATGDIADEVQRNVELSAALKKAEIYREAIYSNAMGYLEADLTDDLVLGDFYEIKNGKPVTSSRFESLPKPMTYTMFANFVYDNLMIDGFEQFDNVFRREKQLELVKKEIFFSELDFSMKRRGASQKMYVHTELFLRKQTTDDHVIAVLVLTDVTGRMEEQNIIEQKEKAEELSRIKSETFAQMTHDIKTPISSIISMAELLRENIDDKERAIETLDKMDMASKHLLSLVDNIQSFGKFEKGKIDLITKQFNIIDFIDEFKALMEGAVAGRDLDIVIEHDSFTNVLLLGDELHLRQILINLLSNAVNATKDGGTISFHVHEISSAGDKELLQFEMIDNGKGLSDEMKSVIFTDLQTSGLGTQIARKFTELMDGSIHAESDKDKGTMITVIIPFQKYEQKRLEDKKSAVGLEGIKFLVAEDNEISRETIKEVLEQAGAIVTAIPNGKAALEVFLDSSANYYDGILTDVTMPIMNGIEFARRVRSSSKPCAMSVPIVAMSADENAISDEDRETSGIDAFLLKPFDMSLFVKTIFSCMRTRSENLAARLENAMSLANKDSLTGVKNATAYKELIQEIETKIQSGQKPEFAIVQCDVNNLKKTNDTQGHDVGDILIKTCCNQICSVFKHSPVFRTGGDEFVVFLENIDYVRRDALYKQAVKYNKDNIKFSFACGLAVYNPIIDSSVQAVVKRADKAMYENKEALKGGKL